MGFGVAIDCDTGLKLCRHSSFNEAAIGLIKNHGLGIGKLTNGYRLPRKLPGD